MSDFDPFDPVNMAMRSLHSQNLLAAKDVQIAELEAENARLKAENENAWGSARTYSRLWIEAKENKERLDAEVERLRASSFVTAVPVEEYEKLKAERDAAKRCWDSMKEEWDKLVDENIRLRKVGDEMAELFGGDYSDNDGVCYDRKWNAAKEGKQP